MKGKPAHVLWFIDSPSPYRIDFFNLLGKEIELRVVADNQYDLERDKSWGKYKTDSFKFVVSGSVSKNIALLKENSGSIVFISNFSTKIGLLTTFYLIAKRIPYIIEIDGGFPGNGCGIKEKIKKMVMKNASSFFSPSRKADEYPMAYGVKRDDIVRYRFTSMFKKDILKKPISDNERKKIKKEFGIKEQKNILFVGRFDFNKGIDVFLNSIKYIKDYDDIGFHMIGGGEMARHRKIIDSSKHLNVHYYDFMDREKIYDFMKAVDILVLPTRSDVWGLVVNEALSCGTPVITTTACIAGIELIKDGYDGYLVDSGNPKQLAGRINRFIWDDDKISKFRINALTEIQNYSLEQMAQDHLIYLEEK